MLIILVVPPETLYMFFLPLLLLTVTYIFIHERTKFFYFEIIIFIDNQGTKYSKNSIKYSIKDFIIP